MYLNRSSCKTTNFQIIYMFLWNLIYRLPLVWKGLLCATRFCCQTTHKNDQTAYGNIDNRKIYNESRTKSLKLNASRLVLQLFFAQSNAARC